MKSIDIVYQSLDLTVFFGECGFSEVCAFAGTKNGKDTYQTLKCFTKEAETEITDLALAELKEREMYEAEEQRDIRNACYDTPYA